MDDNTNPNRSGLYIISIIIIIMMIIHNKYNHHNYDALKHAHVM